MSSGDLSRQGEGAVLIERHASVALLTLSRPAARNAITWAMYEALEAALKEVAADEGVRCLVIRGEGGHFAGGTDIGQFSGFFARDGVAYERRIDGVMGRLASLPKPTIAAVEGYAVGAGLVISSCCDLRFAAPAARFGAPMARTLGNCLSIGNYRRLASALGAMRVKELLFTGRLLSAEEAVQAGFVTGVVSDEGFIARVLELAEGVTQNAPLTIWATKEAYRRLDEDVRLPPFDDVLEAIYGSDDFAEGTRAYLEKRSPKWRGR